ncbi:MAG: DoxX family protein [Cyanobacteria bacterium J06629_9]
MVDTPVQSPRLNSPKASWLQALLGSKSSASFVFQACWLLVRLLAGGLMIHNGLDKLADVSGFAEGVVSYIGLPFPVFFTYCAAYTEVAGAVLLMLGLLTRPSALALLITMVVAIFFHIKGNGFKIAPLETAMLYAVLYGFFLVNGPGRWSLDEVIATRSGRQA